jgi:sugar/nucleoside kinase (ribokinase family)
LGLRVAFIGICGDDIFGRYMLTEMGKRAVDVSHVLIQKAGKTGFSVILNRETDRAILTFLGLIPALSARDIPEDIIQQSRHLHIASYFLQTNLQPDLPVLFRKVRELGLTTSLDTNYDPSEKWDGFDELLSATNVFLPNEREVLSVSREVNLEMAAKKIGSGVDILAVKLGPDGALAVQGNKIVQVDSIPVNVVDTIGAGDSFDAGFLYGYLHGWDVDKSLQLACACGGLSTQKAGGTDGQPELAEALKYVS